MVVLPNLFYLPTIFTACQRIRIVVSDFKLKEMSLFSWKCPFHVFVAGALASTLVSVTSTILYSYSRQLRLNGKRKRVPKELSGTNYDAMLEVATSLALKSGENMLEAIKSKSLSISTKGSTGIDFVTETDKENEKLIFETLKKRFPSHRFIGEESSSSSDVLPELTDEAVWIVDPIDGTTNFVHAYPYSCVSIALVVNKSPVVAVAYDPYKDELFQAVAGRGAYMNGKKITVSDVTEMKNALVVRIFLTTDIACRFLNSSSCV
jgi:hypothetical protein